MIATQTAIRHTAPPLIHYAIKGDLRSVAVLLTEKPDLNATFAGLTARGWAEERGHHSIATLIAWAEENNALGLT
jgi:hypothetical protein